MPKYALGLDYGSLSVRALLVDIDTGEEVGVSVFEYPHGIMDEHIPSGKKLPAKWALQHPSDYMEGLIYTVEDVVRKAGVQAHEIVGIGVDFTSCTVMPVCSNGTPLCLMEEFKNEPHAYVKLWKHHGAEEEAKYISQIATERNEEWLECFGGRISSEWLVPKVLETLNKAPEVYAKADRYMEALDWIVWNLTGVEVRSLHGLRYKAMYNHRTEKPSEEFMNAIDPRMKTFYEDKIQATIKNIGETAGFLTEEMAEKLGLFPGTPIGVGMIDGPAGVLGGGVTGGGEMMSVIGTSFSHCVLSKEEKKVKGIDAIIKDGIIPGYFTYDAGQSGGGDHFGWFVQNCVPESYEVEARDKKINVHHLLAQKLEGYQAGQSGLLALDWFNGVRAPLMDFNLSGLIMGMNLQTKPEEIYLALIEATAYGTRSIVEEFELANIDINSILLSGGIPLKNPMFVQVYADILNREVSVCKTAQSGARGAAILGAAAAPSSVTGYHSLVEIVRKLGVRGEQVYYPNPKNVEVYNKLYAEYKNLQQYFGKGTNDVMKRLNCICDS